MGKKNCIFYLPYPLSKTGNRARQLRPRKMLMAFRELGYSVFLIQGYSDKRKRRIRMLKDLIASGTEFDFLYGECNTEPLRLSDPDHLPRHFGMDFRFFGYLREQGIPMGLFYGDVYWKFPVYRESLSFLKYRTAIFFYRSELRKYACLLNRLFIPDMGMGKYLDTDERILCPLPPGGDPAGDPVHRDYSSRDFDKEPLEIFYVGGIQSFYRIEKLLEAVFYLEKARLTLCVREDEWEKKKDSFAPLLTDRISVVHKNDDELEEFYRKADIGSLIFEPDEYRNMAQPVKAYEYLCHGLPVLASTGTAIGEFVEKTGYGWTVECDTAVIREMLESIIEHPEWLLEKRENAYRAIPENLWTARARKAAGELK